MARQRSKRTWNHKEAHETLAVSQRGWRAITTVAQLRDGQHPEKNPLRQRTLLLAAAIDLVEYNIALAELNRTLLEQMSAETPNSSLPWTTDDDTALVQWRAKGDPLHTIAAHLGRTPAACATRLSTLVGIPRSSIIDGYLSGLLEGEDVRGQFHGEIRRFT